MATASEAYAVDNNKYPLAVTLDQLSALVSPTYIRELPRKDAWGNEYVYLVTPDLQHYRFVSAGADGRFEPESLNIVLGDALAAQKRENTNADEDIVYQDGEFVRWVKE
jgi:hypothetical protein